jgi:predicted dehydrogenase
VKRVLGGEIGDVVSILTRQTIGGLWERENPSGASDIEKQVRNWNKWTWLCGDHYLENHVHSLDMCEWVLGELSPRRAWGFGGREQFKPDSWGNTFDHHAVSYEYPNGVNVESYSGCQGGTAGLYETEVRGTKGTAKLLEHTVRTHDGKRWKFEGEKRSMYVNEQAEFLQAIRKEEPLYNGDYMNHSTLVALLGRWASYTGQIVTMEQAKNSKQVLGPSLYEFASYDAGPKAQPGVTKLA